MAPYTYVVPYAQPYDENRPNIPLLHILSDPICNCWSDFKEVQDRIQATRKFFNLDNPEASSSCTS